MSVQMYQTGNFQSAYTLNMPGGTGTGTGTWTVNESLSTFPTTFPVRLIIYDTVGTFSSTREIVTVSAANTGTKQLTISERGAESTTAANHANASILANVLTAAQINNMITNIDAKAELVTSGSAGTTASNAGTATTAARSDHEHKGYHYYVWNIPTPATGDNQVWLANKWGYDVDIVSAYAVCKTAGTTQSTINIYTCSQANIDGSPSWSSIFSTPISIDANEKSTNTAATPSVLSTTSLTSNTHMKCEFTTVGTNIGATTVQLLLKAKNTN